jgi:hypothetical protein
MLQVSNNKNQKSNVTAHLAQHGKHILAAAKDQTKVKYHLFIYLFIYISLTHYSDSVHQHQ